MQKKILIHDIARHLDVSIATVSLVLNGKAKEQRISDLVAERVRAYVAEVGYKPNQLAKSLRTGKTHVIGLMVEDIANPFFAKIAALIENKALTRGYRIIYCSTHNDLARARDLLAMFQERHVDGYALALPPGVEPEVRALVREGKPVVLFDRLLPDVQAEAIVVDGLTGMYEATRHLLDQGYAHPALVTVRSGQSQLLARRRGYAQALREQNRPELVLEVAFDQEPERLQTEIQNFVRAQPQCDAIIFTTNYLGSAGLEAIQNLDRRIPQDLAFISFDDSDLFRLHRPPLTVVAQPMELLAESIINHLLAALEGRVEPGRITQTQLAPQLLVRQSSLRVGGNE